ncbi:MAG TPA: hypothetical protein VMU04_13670 [Candidatus Acidoferrum sp.]|nr:hypothetical protein [Candidatus Acidoferrum sp.]
MKRLLFAACLLIVLGLGLFLALPPARPAPPPPVIVMQMPYSIPRQKLSLFDQYVPRRRSWAWVWRLKETVLGRSKTCQVGATVVDCSGAGESFWAKQSLPTPAFTNPSGLRIWFLPEQNLAALTRAFQRTPGAGVLYQPRIITGDGHPARLMSGGMITGQGVQLAPAGLLLDILPRMGSGRTELTTIIRVSEALTNRTPTTAMSPSPADIQVQTNFEVAAQLQVPKGTGVFLLAGPPAEASRPRIGVALSVQTSAK